MAAISNSAARLRALAALLAGGSLLAACATPQPRYSATTPQPGKGQAQAGGYKVGKPYQVGGVWYVPREDADYDETGVASWYGKGFQLRPTANGETFDMALVTAAHPTLPLPSLVEVTNLENGKKLVVRVNDRGPFVGGRLIDLSQEAARQLGFERQGLARVRVRYVGRAPLGGEKAGVRYASAASSPAAKAPAQPEAYVPASRPSVDHAAPLADMGWPDASRSATPTLAGAFKVQAGAFLDPANARRAADRLAAAGPATIEPVERDGATLYRVVLNGSDDEAQAWRLRDRAADLGFADAKVVRAF